jgi:hypothetical protein
MFNLAIRQILLHVVAVTRKKTFKACPLLKSPLNNYQKLPIMPINYKRDNNLIQGKRAAKPVLTEKGFVICPAITINK